MRLVTGAEMAAIDREAIHGRGTLSLEMMEMAGEGVADAILEGFPESSRPLIVCGKGNNGGDGFVVARLLDEAGLSPVVVSVGPKNSVSEDARVNWRRFESSSGVRVAVYADGRTSFDAFLREIEADDADLVVDALFGTGFSGEVRAPYDEIIQTLNDLPIAKVAIDMPSGVSADDGSVGNVAFRADLTVTMALPKVGQFVLPGQDCAGAVEVVPIGIPDDLLESGEEDEIELIDAGSVVSWLPKYARCSHKGDRGHLLIITGAPGMTGAGCLAAEGALVSGAGLVTVAVPKSLNSIYEVKLTEAMSLPLSDIGTGRIVPEGLEDLRPALEKASAVVFGPGVGIEEGAWEFLEALLPMVEAPLLLDADGLNLLAGRLSVLSGRKAPTLLTPHPGEMARLLGVPTEEVQAHRWDKAMDLALETGAVVVLKGAGTVVSDGRKMWINSTGGPAMAQGGMGDVLSGAIGARLAGGAAPLKAAAAGVYLHGLAADLVASNAGWTTVMAGEVIEELRNAEVKARMLTGV